MDSVTFFATMSAAGEAEIGLLRKAVTSTEVRNIAAIKPIVKTRLSKMSFFFM